eukprot:5119371-Prymnesium_polylepis.1
MLSREHPALLDAALFPCGRCASLYRQQPSLFGNASQSPSLFGNAPQGLTDAQYAEYKYVIE